MRLKFMNFKEFEFEIHLTETLWPLSINRWFAWCHQIFQTLRCFSRNEFGSEIAALMNGLGVNWIPVQTEEKTLGASLWRARSHVETPFVLALGDCLFDGEFETTCLRGVGVKEGSGEFFRSYAVGLDNEGNMGSLIEKPLLGLGCYWFDESDLEFFREGGGMEHALGRGMAKHSFQVNRFTGDYLNVTYPEDLDAWK